MDPPDPPRRAPSASGLASPGHRFPLGSWPSQRGPWVSRGSRPKMEALELLAGRAPEAGRWERRWDANTRTKISMKI